MRLFLIANLLILSVGIGYSFRITEYLEPLLRNGYSNQNDHQYSRDGQYNDEGQESSDIEDQILPLFLVTFAATTFWNLMTMGGGAMDPAIVNCDGNFFDY